MVKLKTIKFKKLLALMLAFALVFGTVPVSAAANAMDGTFVPAQQEIGQRLGNGYVDFAPGHFPDTYEAYEGQENLVFSQYVTVTSPGALTILEPMATVMPFVDNMQDLFDIAENGGTATLTGDIFIETGGNIPWRLHVLHVENDMVIDLNGHTLAVRAVPGPTNAIMIDSGSTLTIRDSAGGGLLYVRNAAGQSNAGNGAAINTSAGTLIIESGRVEATGAINSAGIGGGNGQSGGTVIIEGTADVTARGGNSGAGIGGGNGGAGGSITIRGNAQVEAIGTGGSVASAAGIGGGLGSAGGTITIEDSAYVTAVGGGNGAGIGGGGTRGLIAGDGGTITISGGTVTATGADNGAGIGGGGIGAGHTPGAGGNVTISGDAHVTANSGPGYANARAGGIGAGMNTVGDFGSAGSLDVIGGNATVIQDGVTTHAPTPVITAGNISITAPVGGAARVATASVEMAAPPASFTSSPVTWTPGTGNFEFGADYTASVTLTAAPGFTFDGLAANTIQINGVAGAHAAGAGNTLTVTRTFTTGSAPPDAIPVTSITVTGANGATTITTNNGTLQMSAAVLPIDATNQAVTWSVINGTGSATINATGLLTAETNGTVTVRATANDGSGVYGELQITISGQTVAITNFTVNFNLNGGTRTGGGQLAQTVQAGGAAIAPTLTRSNHSFNGWSSSVAGMTLGNITGNVTFTAQWTWAGGSNDNGGNGDRDWRIHAQSPRITTQPRNVTVYVSEQATLSVAANITDEGTLTFQWYRAEEASGGSFRAISGATDRNFSPDTRTAGVNRYRVVITNTNNAARITGNRTARTTSHTVTVTVVEPAPAATPSPEQMPLPTPTQDPLVNDNFNPPTGAGWQNPFIDVSGNDWFFEFVRFAHMNNLFSGTSATTFSPNAPIDLFRNQKI